MIALYDTLATRSFQTLTVQDIITPGSSDGITVLVAIILEIVQGSIMQIANVPQLHNLAHSL